MEFKEGLDPPPPPPLTPIFPQIHYCYWSYFCTHLNRTLVEDGVSFVLITNKKSLWILARVYTSPLILKTWKNHPNFVPRELFREYIRFKSRKIKYLSLYQVPNNIYPQTSITPRKYKKTKIWASKHFCDLVIKLYILYTCMTVSLQFIINKKMSIL